MPLKFTCKYCGGQIIAADLEIDDTALCGNCKKYNVIPIYATEISPDVIAVPPEEHDEGNLDQPPESLAFEGRPVGAILNAVMTIYFDSSRFFRFIWMFLVFEVAIPFLASLPLLIIVIILSIAQPQNIKLYSYSMVIASIPIIFISSSIYCAIVSYLAMLNSLGQTAGIRICLRSIKYRLKAFIGTSTLNVIIFLGMLVTIIGIPFAFYYGILWSLAPIVSLMEGKSGMMALRRSKELVGPHWGTLFVCGLIFSTPVAVQLIFQLFISNAIAFLISIVSISLVMIFPCVAYLYLRTMKEGLTKRQLANEIASINGSQMVRI